MSKIKEKIKTKQKLEIDAMLLQWANIGSIYEYIVCRAYAHMPYKPYVSVH